MSKGPPSQYSSRGQKRPQKKSYHNQPPKFPNQPDTQANQATQPSSTEDANSSREDQALHSSLERNHIRPWVLEAVVGYWLELVQTPFQMGLVYSVAHSSKERLAT